MKKQFLSLGLMLLAGVAMAQYPTTGLVAYFPLDGNGNAASPSTITPSVFSALGATDRNGEANKCLQFVSASDHKVDYSLDDHAALQLTGDFTIAFWSKSSPELVANAMLVSLADKAGFHHSVFNGNVNFYGFAYTSGGGGWQYGGNLPNAQTIWRHYMLVRSGGNIAMYLNNGSLGGFSAGLDPISYNAGDVLSLGQNATANTTGAQTATGKLDGYLDDLLIYDRALDATERGQVFAFNTCVAITSVPTVTAAGPACAGQEVDYTLSHPNATSYSFTPENDWTGVLNGNVLTMTVPANPMFNYQYLSFTVRAENVCSTGPDQQIALPIVTPPAPFVVNAPATTCLGSLVALSVESTTDQTTWEVPNGWVQTLTYPNNNGGQHTAGESGIISFTKTNACFSRTETAEVIVRTGPPAAPLVVLGSTVLCMDEPMLIAFSYDSTSTFNQMVLPSFTGSWTFTALSDTSFEVTASGTFTGPFTGIWATANNACGGTTTELSLTANGESPSAGTFWYQDGADLVVLGNLNTHTFQWLLEGNPIPGATGLTYTPLVSGNYALEATMLNFPCPPYTTASQYIEVIVTGVEENGTSRLNLYPNPASSVFTMDGLTAGSTITLMDAMGRTVSTTAVTAARMEVSVAALSTGIYMVQVMDGNAVRTARLVVN